MSVVKFVKRNVRRTPYQAISVTMIMFLTFFCLSVFSLVTYGSEKVLRFLESKPQVIAFFKDGTSEEDVNAIKGALTQTGRVTNLNYVTKEQALEIYKEKNKDNPLLLELVTANILPTSLEISTLSPKDLEPVSEILKREPVVEEVVFPKDVVQFLSQSTQVIRWVGLALVTFLLLFSTFVVLMVIGLKIRLRRNEIRTMKLLGASSWFIRAPFVLEGMFYGVTGAFLAWGLVYIILFSVAPSLQSRLSNVPIDPTSPLIMLLVLLINLVVAALIGAIGSFGAVRRYLKV